jgi:rhodanese-related sulfurtransferase
MMEATRVTVDEVKERINRGELFTFVDTRNPTAWAEADQKLPGAIRVPEKEVTEHLDDIPRDRTVITYCTCPHEASSSSVAQTLAENGWKNVHPLCEGFDAWKNAGLPLDAKQ